MVRSALAVPGAARTTAGLTVGVTARSGGDRLALQLTFVEPGALWRPTIAEGSSRGGIVLSRKAADDLGVGVGGRSSSATRRAARAVFRSSIRRSA